VRFVKWNNDKNFVRYTFDVVGPVGLTFSITDRYRSMRLLYDSLRKGRSGVPPFPPKRIFGNISKDFIN